MAAAVSLAALLAAFWFVAAYFGLTARLGSHAFSTFLSFALLFTPYWGFGFGLGDWLRARVRQAWARVALAPLLIIPYLTFAVPRGELRLSEVAAIFGTVLTIAALLATARRPAPAWQDWLVLAILALGVELHFLDAGWSLPGLNGFPKLMLVDAGLYGFLVIRPIGGIGYDFRVRFSDVWHGLREFVFFTPIALVLGFTLGFLHLHSSGFSGAQFGAGWLFTLFFIAIPEELYFRGLLLNLLERKAGTRRALVISSLLFGLAHFNKRAAYFNWRYTILAAIAGVFYGRAWLARRRVAASSITHATVDTVWSIWLR